MELQSRSVPGGSAVQDEVSSFRPAVAIAALLIALAGAAAASLAAVRLGFADPAALLSLAPTVEKAIFGATVLLGAAILQAMSGGFIGDAVDITGKIAWRVLIAALPILAAILGFAVFGLVAGGHFPIKWAGTVSFLLVFGVLIWLVHKQFLGNFEEKDSAQQYWGVIVAIAFTGLVFSPYLLDAVLQLGAWFQLDTSWLLVPKDRQGQGAANDVTNIGSHVEALLQRLVPAAATAAGVTVAVKVVGPPLAGLLDYIGMSDGQRAAGRRLRQPVANVVKDEKKLTKLYKVHVNLTPTSTGQDLPHLRDSTDNRAIIRISLPASPNLDLRIFEFEKMRELLAGSGVSLTNSLFFVYGSGGLGSAPPVCYGTGSELFEILAPPGSDACGRLRGRFSEAFVNALKQGNAPRIATLAEEAREAILAQSPQDDALLATASMAEGEETIEVMREMTSRGLRRILITSRRAPIERAIVSAAELSAFLLAPPENV